MRFIIRHIVCLHDVKKCLLRGRHTPSFLFCVNWNMHICVNWYITGTFVFISQGDNLFSILSTGKNQSPWSTSTSSLWSAMLSKMTPEKASTHQGRGGGINNPQMQHMQIFCKFILAAKQICHSCRAH